MNKNANPTTGEFREDFIERPDALAQFKACCAVPKPPELCGVYFCGPGGQGKTYILRWLYEIYAGDEAYTVLPLIDFYNTENHSIGGLQRTIRVALGADEAFDAYDLAVADLEAARDAGRDVSIIAGLRARVERAFLTALNTTAARRPVVLLFDTFERVQNRDVGQWVTETLLPNLNYLCVAIAGRPEPEPAEMPVGVGLYDLSGFAFEETLAFFAERSPDLPEEDVRCIWAHTAGAPLMLNLVADFLDYDDAEAGPAFLDTLCGLPDGVLIQEDASLLKRLVKQFSDMANRTHVVMWAMAYLHRRFDTRMLTYLMDHLPLLKAVNARALLDRLWASPYIKEHPHLQSHLLHDEVRRLISTYILDSVDPNRQFRDGLYDLVVGQYYREAIEDAPVDLARQLHAERFGYALDQALLAPDAALEARHKAMENVYDELYADIEVRNDYAFEELVWAQMRDYFEDLLESEVFQESKYRIYNDRSQFLQRHRLFRKMELHYRRMDLTLPSYRANTLRGLSFALLRQGKLDEAEEMIEQCDKLVDDDDLVTVAHVENVWGQIARAAGRWQDALAHYQNVLDCAEAIRDRAMIASAQINRSYIWASQGHYVAARKQCEHALRQLAVMEQETGHFEVRRAIYAHLNMGSAYRYEGDYEKAETSYRQSLSFAELVKDQESICEVTQHLGINEHLRGRLLRRDVLEENACRLEEGPAPISCRSALAEACEHQLQAWRYLTDAFEMAYETDWRSAMASTLHRLAKVYREIFRIHLLLEESDLGPAPGDLARLEALADAYPMPLEMQYEGRLVVKEPFADLDWIGKALKLFDLSAWLADEVNDLHRALDALTELARAAAERREPETLREVLDRVEHLRGYDVQRELFDAMNDIARADLHLIQEEYDRALVLYKDAYVRVAEKSGYADFLLLDRLRDLQWRLEELPAGMALQWLRELQRTWEVALAGNENWPEMVTLLEDVRFHFLSL
jgi:hypothetical protein